MALIRANALRISITLATMRLNWPRMPKSPDKLTARIARYHARLKKAGMVAVRVWVPKDKADALKRFAARLRGH